MFRLLFFCLFLELCCYDIISCSIRVIKHMAFTVKKKTSEIIPNFKIYIYITEIKFLLAMGLNLSSKSFCFLWITAQSLRLMTLLWWRTCCGHQAVNLFFGLWTAIRIGAGRSCVCEILRALSGLGTKSYSPVTVTLCKETDGKKINLMGTEGAAVHAGRVSEADGMRDESFRSSR